MNKYRTIVIDFPWPLKVGGNVPKSMQGTTLATKLAYGTMPPSDIQKFPIDDFAAEECLLFIWVTNGKMSNGYPIVRFGFELLEEWGFSYHHVITWVKTSPFAFWSPITSATEHVLFGYRGELPKCYGVMPGVFTAPNHKHSEKPARFYQLLRSWTPAPRIDLFARQAHEGFDGWGDEYAGEHGPLLPFLKEGSKK